MASKKAPSAEKGDAAVRERILGAAMETFMEHGFAARPRSRSRRARRFPSASSMRSSGTSRNARCVRGRARTAHAAARGLSRPTDAASLRSALRQYGATMLRELTDPGVLAVFRLAIAESKRSPGVAASIDKLGRQPARAALESLLRSARAAELLGDHHLPSMMARYQGLMWGDCWCGSCSASRRRRTRRRSTAGPRKGRASSSASMVANELSADRIIDGFSSPFPAKAVSSAAMSIFFIRIIAAKARSVLFDFAFLKYPAMPAGTICHESPYLSLSQPHWRAFGRAFRRACPSSSRSLSGCGRTPAATTASLNLKIGPALSAVKGKAVHDEPPSSRNRVRGRGSPVRQPGSD